MRKLESDCVALMIGSSAAKYWFRHAREAKDVDLYAMPSFVPGFIQRSGIEVRKQTERKLVGKIGEKKIDFIVHTPGSWVVDVLNANRDSKVIDIYGCKVMVAKPTTLRLIKEVMCCFPRNWYKHMLDFIFLKSIVLEPYTELEVKAFNSGMTYLQEFYPDRGLPVQLGEQYTLRELEKVAVECDFRTRVFIKNNIDNLLGAYCEAEIN